MSDAVSIRLQLFRVHSAIPAQRPLTPGPETPSEAFRAALEERPSLELRAGHTWHVGNLERLDAVGLYFAFGRTTAARVATYDPRTGDFVEREFDAAPYTHALADTSLGLCALAGKPRLAPTIAGIGRQLERVLNATHVAHDAGVHFEVATINDPDDFLARVADAQAVVAFSMTFTRPNPFDVNRDFQRPMEELLRAAAAEKGKTEVRGPDLDKSTIEELSRSVAATGNDAAARMQDPGTDVLVTRHLRGNPALAAEDALDDLAQKRDALHRVREIYRRIRYRATS